MAYCSIFMFIMSDVYNFMKSIYQWMKVAKDTLFNEYAVPYKLVSVKVHQGDSVHDITKEYASGIKCLDKFSDYVAHVTWKYKNNEYRYAFQDGDVIEFPPYTFEEMNQKPLTRVMSISVNDDPNHYDILRSYAGPKHNFYSDKTKHGMDVRWIIPQASDVEIIDSIGKFYSGKNNFKEILFVKNT